MENEAKLLKKKYIWISVLILLGLVITIDLAFIYYQANFNEYALPSFCSISDFVDCDGVARTLESQFLGVPLAYWGLFLYAFMGMLLFVDKLKKIPFLKFLEVFKNKFHYIASLGLISFTISMILLCVSLFDIKKLCIMCVFTYVINFCIGLIAAEGIKGHFIGAIKQSWNDFISALKPLPYKIAFGVVMVCACGFLYWTYTSAKFSPALKFYHNYGEFVRIKQNKYAITGNVLGSDAKDAVVVHIYSDYNCPMCFTINVMLHKLVRDYKNVRVEHHSMPLDMQCNKYLTQEFHRGSCVAAQYAEAAKEQGKFWEVHSLLFEKKPATELAVIDALENSGFNLDMNKLKKDAHSSKIMKEIENDIDYAFSNKMIGTPSVKIGDRFEMGVKGYPELKKWVEENGAKPSGLF